MAEGYFYTYVHRKGDDGEVFYVGKGKGNRAFSRSCRSEFWNRVAKKYGYTVEIVNKFPDEESAFTDERRLIAEYRLSGASLCNATDGGEGATGAKRSEETKRKISAFRKSCAPRVWTEDQKARQSVAQTGKRMHPDAVEKTAAAHRGMKRSDETKARISASLKGKGLGVKQSPERIALSVAARKGRPMSDQGRANISAGHANRTVYCAMSEDHKRKILEGQKAYWERWRKEKLAPKDK